jgi:hypothetical protein
VFDALRVFSLRSLVAAKDGVDAQLVAGERGGWELLREGKEG